MLSGTRKFIDQLLQSMICLGDLVQLSVAELIITISFGIAHLHIGYSQRSNPVYLSGLRADSVLETDVRCAS